MNKMSRSDRFLYHLEIFSENFTEIAPRPIKVRNGLVSSQKASKKRTGRRGENDFFEANEKQSKDSAQ